jgi:hypothetical protein
MSKDKNEDGFSFSPEPVTNGDIEFLLFLAESDDDKDAKEKFIVPANIFRIYIEHTTIDDPDAATTDAEKEVVYNIYVVTDGMYYLAASKSSYQEARNYGQLISIRMEKQLKRILSKSLISSMNELEERDDNEQNS